MPMTRSLSRQERRRAAAILFAASVVAMSLVASTARGEETVRQVLPGAPAAEPPQQLTRQKAPDQSEIERFCSNIADAARDRRYALQAEEMKQLQAGIDQRMKALEEKRAEYETWLKRREVFLARAEDGVVQIYAGMKPDAAAERLAIVNADLAAAILMKLDSRKASVILNEMDQKAAATLTGIMASAARRVDPS
ncbi:MotE family protein [Mesorhizobium sophorae]|uniref:MotE family protein n=1 Tax=Mesorhizobium sophorae TaxID=1300294 RepID=UPI00142D28DB|nr:MotE family protein [Mesorhizobium sophorae]